MSVEAMTWAWSQTVGDAGAKAVLVALANFADEDGRCWPGVARLAHMTDQGERTVRRHLAALIEGSFIRREPRYVKTTGARDRDAFVFLAPPEQLAKTRGPQRSTTPGQNDRSGQSGRVPRPKPPVTLTTPPVTGASPPGQLWPGIRMIRQRTLNQPARARAVRPRLTWSPVARAIPEWPARPEQLRHRASGPST